MAPIVFVAHRMAQATVTLHGTTQSAEFTPQNALIESSYLAATFMLTFGLKVPPVLATRPPTGLAGCVCQHAGRRTKKHQAALSVYAVCASCAIHLSMQALRMVSRLASDCAMKLLQMRWHLHVPVNAFFVAVTLLQNSYVCRAAWPGVPGALPAALSPGWSGLFHCPGHTL